MRTRSNVSESHPGTVSCDNRPTIAAGAIRARRPLLPVVRQQRAVVRISVRTAVGSDRAAVPRAVHVLRQPDVHVGRVQREPRRPAERVRSVPRRAAATGRRSARLAHRLCTGDHVGYTRRRAALALHDRRAVPVGTHRLRR